jgi:hypothetical protein
MESQVDRSAKNYILIESSHLFRAGEKFGTQLFVADVASYLYKLYGFQGPSQSIVLFGSTKEEQAIRYIRSLAKNHIEVVRMNPIESKVNSLKKYYKPVFYLHQILHEIPRGSRVILVGFHNHRYEEILVKHSANHEIHVAAFATSTTRGDLMHIPEGWSELCSSCIELDSHVDLIKEEYLSTKV